MDGAPMPKPCGERTARRRPIAKSRASAADLPAKTIKPRHLPGSWVLSCPRRRGPLQEVHHNSHDRPFPGLNSHPIAGSGRLRSESKAFGPTPIIFSSVSADIGSSIGRTRTNFG